MVICAISLKISFLALTFEVLNINVCEHAVHAPLDRELRHECIDYTTFRTAVAAGTGGRLAGDPVIPDWVGIGEVMEFRISAQILLLLQERLPIHVRRIMRLGIRVRQGRALANVHLNFLTRFNRRKRKRSLVARAVHGLLRAIVGSLLASVCRRSIALFSFCSGFLLDPRRLRCRRAAPVPIPVPVRRHHYLLIRAKRSLSQLSRRNIPAACTERNNKLKLDGESSPAVNGRDLVHCLTACQITKDPIFELLQVVFTRLWGT